MKKCDKCSESDGIVKLEVPDNTSNFLHEFLHICTKCWHAVWPGTGRPDAEDRASSHDDDTKAL